MQHYKPPNEENVTPFRPTTGTTRSLFLLSKRYLVILYSKTHLVIHLQKYTAVEPTAAQDGNNPGDSTTQDGSDASATTTGNDSTTNNGDAIAVDETQENDNTDRNGDPEAIARDQLASENGDGLGVGPAVMIGVGGAAVLLAAGYFTMMRPK